MGAGSSGPAFCGVGGREGEGGFDLSCGLTRSSRRNMPLSDDDPAIAAVAGWIAAREAGDVELAASYCHKEFVFASPQLSLAGLEAAKKRLFSQQAPVPLEVITTLQSKEGSTTERPMYFREVSFKVGANKLAIRQEWVILLSGGKPLIGSVSASRVAPNRAAAPSA